MKRELEEGAAPREMRENITLPDAFGRFIADCQARNLSPASMVKYERLRSRIEAYWGKRPLNDFTHAHAVEFRSRWKLAAISSAKELERMKTVFSFFLANGWIDRSPVAHLKPPVVKPSPTLPFTEKETAAIIKAADFRSGVFFRVLLHSGLRIIDAARLGPDRIENGALFLYQQKTGVPVRVPLPPDLLRDLKKLAPFAGMYFRVASERPASIAEYYRVKLLKAAKKANVAHAHPHRWRDSFAVRLLEKNVPLETVSILLGHTNVRTTQKSYAPWVPSLQRNLEAAVRQTWA